MTTDTDGFEALLRGRYSCRAFRPDPVPRETIDRFAAIAQRTPSWCNSQPWQLAVASAPTTERLRARLLDYVRSHPASPDFTWPLEYRGVYNSGGANAGYSSTRRSVLNVAIVMPPSSSGWRTSVSSALRMSRSSVAKRRWEPMARLTAAPM